MYNQNQNQDQDHHHHHQHHHHHKLQAPPPMSPRISFSNDFVESSRSLSTSHSSLSSLNNNRPSASASYRDAPVSSDFEFSVANYDMISADELIFKGRLLPLKDNCTSTSSKTTTLRDELQNHDEDQASNNNSSRPPKNPTRWRGFLGLRKSHIGSKKSSSDKRPSSFHNDDDNNNSQEYVD